MSETSWRYCVDCKHYGNYGGCFRSRHTITDIVTGNIHDRGELNPRAERKPIGVWDYIARLWGVYRCGPEGVFWEEKK